MAVCPVGIDRQHVPPHLILPGGECAGDGRRQDRLIGGIGSGRSHHDFLAARGEEMDVRERHFHPLCKLNTNDFGGAVTTEPTFGVALSRKAWATALVWDPKRIAITIACEMMRSVIDLLIRLLP